MSKLISARQLIQLQEKHGLNGGTGRAYLDLANSCAEIGKSKCATSEWFDYPENMPKEGEEYLVELEISKSPEHPENDFIKIIGFFDGDRIFRCCITNNELRNVKRFAEIKP